RQLKYGDEDLPYKEAESRFPVGYSNDVGRVTTTDDGRTSVQRQPYHELLVMEPIMRGDILD
ncbi:hypothetical protein AVEN_182570-1, partial [Araneus ventricosus]